MSDWIPSPMQNLNIRDLVSRGLNSATVINTFWLGSSSIVAAVLGAITSAVMARSLGVAEFGILTLVITMMNLMVEFADLGMTSTFVRFGSESIAAGDATRFRQVLAVMLRYKLMLGVVVIGIAFLLTQTIVGYAFQHVDDRIVSYFQLCLVSAGLGIAASIYYPILQSYKNFRLHSILSTVRVGSKLLFVLIVIMVLHQMTVMWGIWVEIATVFLFLLLNVFYSPVKSYPFVTVDKTIRKEMLSFNKWLLLYQVITLASARLDIFFVGGLATANDLGLYSAASKITGLVLALANSYYAVLLTEISAQSSDDGVKRHKRRATYAALLFSGSVLFLALLSEPIIHLLYGSDFDGAGLILQIMCIGIIFATLAYPVNAALFAYNRSEVFSIMAAVSGITIIAGNVFMIPRYGSRGAAIVFAFAAFVSWAVASGYYLWVKKALRKQ